MEWLTSASDRSQLKPTFHHLLSHAHIRNFTSWLIVSALTNQPPCTYKTSKRHNAMPAVGEASEPTFSIILFVQIFTALSCILSLLPSLQGCRTGTRPGRWRGGRDDSKTTSSQKLIEYCSNFVQYNYVQYPKNCTFHTCTYLCWLLRAVLKICSWVVVFTSCLYYYMLWLY